MSPCILDANVLYPSNLRDILLSLANEKLYSHRWTQAIIDEWIRSVLKNRPNYDPGTLARTVQVMNGAFPEASVVGFEHRIDEIELPDVDDRHVLAAAREAMADTIITSNVSDFPDRILNPLGLRAIHPDVFVSNLLGSHMPIVIGAIHRMRRRFKAPELTVDQLFSVMKRNSLPRFAAALAPFADQL